MTEHWIGPWIELTDGRGVTLAIAGDYTAAAQLSRLTVWSGDRLVAKVESPAREPGRPCIVERQVFWGDGKLDLADGEYRRLSGVEAALVIGTAVPPSPSPRNGYVPETYAWAADGQALVVAATWMGTAGPPPVRVLLLDGSGDHRATLWQGSDLAPQAAWVGRNLIVVGFREPQVFDRAGSYIMTLAGTTPAARIEASAGETRLLVVEHGRLVVWDTATWKPVGEWKGNWVDAALTPDGTTVIGVDFAGRIQIAHLDGNLAPIGEAIPPDQARAIATGQDRVVAAFATGAAVRTAQIILPRAGQNGGDRPMTAWSNDE